MKLWKNFVSSTGLSTLDRHRDRSGSAVSRHSQPNTPLCRRSRERSGEQSLSEDNSGTTFVELIKRSGTHLGVIIDSDLDIGLPPRIADLIPGSWAQRSNVLCVGDVIINMNGRDTSKMALQDVINSLDSMDKIQLEVKYPLPSCPQTNKNRTRVIQVTLRKQNGSLGIVVRGGSHQVASKSRPFTVVHIDKGGPAHIEGTIKVGDRITAVNGKTLEGMRLPELQGLLYHQDENTVFTIVYDVAKKIHTDQGPLLVEIRRRSGDMLGLGLTTSPDTNAIIIESIKQGSLADRCGVLHVGDIILAVGGHRVGSGGRNGVDDVSRLIRDQAGPSVQLQVLAGLLARTNNNIRSSLPSPSFSTISRREKLEDRLPKQLSHSNLLDLKWKADKERRKFVSFTVELDRTGGPVGITLATHQQDPSIIFISSLLEGGLAKTTKTIQLNDQLVEINGISVRDKTLSEAISLLQDPGTGSILKLKLMRVVMIPERIERDYLRCRNLDVGSPRPPSKPTPRRSRSSTLVPGSISSTGSNTSQASAGHNDHIPIVSLFPKKWTPGAAGSGTMDPTKPAEISQVTLFKDSVYEDFGFSVSDGLYERGIFINRVRRGGPADKSGILKQFDRILQINSTRTTDFDCCLAVPLIAAAGDTIHLLVTRSPVGSLFNNNVEDDDQTNTNSMLWIDETESNIS